MSTHVEEIQSHGPGIPTFAKVWAALLAMTAMEVFLAYMQTPMMIMLTVLLGLSVIKAALIIFCIVLMLIFLGDAYRIPNMRPPV